MHFFSPQVCFKIAALTWINFLSKVHKAVGGGPRGSVMHDGFQQGFVNLRLIKSTEDKDDVWANALQGPFVTEKAGHPIHECIAW